MTSSLQKSFPFLEIRNQRKLLRLLRHINKLPLNIDWDQLIEFQIKCLRNGVDGIGIPDLMVAQNAKQNLCEIYSLDNHFQLMKDIVGFGSGLIAICFGRSFHFEYSKAVGIIRENSALFNYQYQLHAVSRHQSVKQYEMHKRMDVPIPYGRLPRRSLGEGGCAPIQCFSSLRPPRLCGEIYLLSSPL